MPSDQITFRLDPRVRAAITELIRRGEYRNLSEFITQAILMKCQVERVPIEGELLGPDPFFAFLESPRGRALLRELLREIREP
jgi:hypothetical protein